ncbi:MAG: helix-turn-helix transcriptional regulator [Halioglobus sp.]
MTDGHLQALGARVAELRIARQLKQTELAYEAGVSHRTLQRLEAGEVVGSDVLVKVLGCLGKLDGVMDALALAGFSPYARLAEAGLTVARLKKPREALASDGAPRVPRGASRPAPGKRRVRRSRRAEPQATGTRVAGAVNVQWPEDRK